MGNQQAEWIEIDEDRYNEAKEKDARSVFIEMSVSPYDVPHQVRGGFDSNQKMFVIEFRYIDDEPARRVRLEPHVSALVGKHSGRVYSLIVDVEALNAESVALAVTPDDVKRDATHALSRLSGLRSAERPNSKNYRVASEVLGDYWNTINQRSAVAG